MELFDPLKTFLALGVALRNLLTHFPDLKPWRLPFMPKDLDGVNEELKKVDAFIFYSGSKFEVGSGFQLPADPYIRILNEFAGEVTVMDRITALTEYARAMAVLCEATITEGIPQDGYHLRLWEVYEHDAWAKSLCCFFDFPDTTLEEREAIASALDFDVVAFHSGKMFVHIWKEESLNAKHQNTLSAINWSYKKGNEESETRQIFFWTREEMNQEKAVAFLRGFKSGSCWFVDWPMVHQSLTVGHRYLIGQSSLDC